MPALCNVLLPSPESALEITRGDLDIVSCAECGHVYNAAFDSTLTPYTEAYENSLHFSPRFQAYADDLAKRLIERYGLRDKTIIEIGCGKGDFLASLCRRGGNTGIGFDPSFDPQLAAPDAFSEITVIPDLYSKKYGHLKADFIYCRHVLEHVAEPRTFLRTIRQAIGGRRQTVVFFEVPNVVHTLDNLAIWDLIYEHYSYFSPSSLRRLFEEGGFEVCSLEPAFDGQFLCLEARPGLTARLPRLRRGDEKNQIFEGLTTFRERYESKVAQWRELLRRLEDAGKRVVIWGAGSKGVTLSNILGVQNQVPYVVDVNPRKQGMFVSGTGQQIVAPEFLRDYAPDVVIVMNAIYTNEIQTQMSSLGIGAELVPA